MLKEYTVFYTVRGDAEIKTAQCLLDETQTPDDFSAMLAIRHLFSVRDASRILVTGYERLTFNGSC